MIKPRRMTWAGLAACMGITAYKILARKPEETMRLSTGLISQYVVSSGRLL
jgi:uncharacterized OsmC-like protein